MAIAESNLGKYPYITLAETKDYLNITSNYACGVIEHYIGREVLANNYTEQFDGGTSSIFVSRLPLSNVYSVFEHDGTRYQSLNPPTADGSAVELDSDNHTMNVNGDAYITTRIKKFGQSSMYFDGNGDYITTGNGDDWWFDTEPFTIDPLVFMEAYLEKSSDVSCLIPKEIRSFSASMLRITTSSS